MTDRLRPFILGHEHRDRWAGLLSSWLLALEAEGKSPRTLESYHYGPVRLSEWFEQLDLGDDVQAITPELLREHLATVGRELSAQSARSRYVGLKSFLQWCADEGEVDTSPMSTIKQPAVQDPAIEVLRPEQLRALIDSCNTRSFVDVRDLAMLSFLADNGCRLSGLVSMTVTGTDLRERVAHVVTKGGRELDLPFGASTARALDRYLRARRRENYSERDWFWLGTTGKGRLTGNGAYQAIRKRGARLGFHLHPHMLRHTFLDQWLRSGGSETAAMDIAGWKSRQMLGRYAAKTRSERARLEHSQRSPMDNL